MRWKEAAALASTQFGLLAVWQAAELGISRQLLAQHARDHGWVAVRRGIYRLPGFTFPPIAQLKAAELQLRGHGIASGATAGFVWGLVSRLPRPMDFLVPRDCSRRPPGTRVTRVGSMPTPVIRQGIAVTPAAWAICTASPFVDTHELARMIAAADRKRVCPRSDVRALVEEQPLLRARAKTLAALAARPLSHSELEALGRRRLREADLHPHDRPHLVLDQAGARVGELDIAFIDEQVGIPIDGPHHFEPAQKRADDDQRHKLRLMGWTIVPADEHRLVNQPGVFIRQVREALQQRR
jgi:hypothetical protein